MQDTRITKLAKLMTEYSAPIKKGGIVGIYGSVISMPLAKELYKQALLKGAYPVVRFPESEIIETLLRYGGEKQLKYFSPIDKLEISTLNVRYKILSDTNTRYLSGIDTKKQATLQKAMRPFWDIHHAREKKGELIWSLTCYPTHAFAQDAEMSLEEFENFVFDACKLNYADPVKVWKKISKEQERIVKFLDKHTRYHIKTKDTNLKFSTKGRKWINCDGQKNMPDGEIFTSPVENSVEGYIRYSFPACLAGREVEDVRLEFRNGKVTKVTASKNQDFLHKTISIDDGARRVGEIAIGTNYNIKRFTKNILFDEKIGGTCHLALGFSIPESKGKNKSAIHWDMICDLRKNSEIYADGKLLYKNGKFLI